MAPPNRHRRVRKQEVAECHVEYFPGAWDQTYAVTWHATTGGWTVFDIRDSEDGGGTLDQTFATIDGAVGFVVDEISGHGRHVTRMIWIRPLDADDHVRCWPRTKLERLFGYDAPPRLPVVERSPWRRRSFEFSASRTRVSSIVTAIGGFA